MSPDSSPEKGQSSPTLIHPILPYFPPTAPTIQGSPIMGVQIQKAPLQGSSAVSTAETVRCLGTSELTSRFAPAFLDRKTRSETSLASTLLSTTKNVSAIHPKGAVSNVAAVEDSIFVKSHEADDVFRAGTNNGVLGLKEADSSPTAPQMNDAIGVSTPATNKFAPRADRIGSPITPANAQGLLPPEACVFVANLAMSRTDEQLEYSCHQAFDIFGRNVIKVRRDRHKHPFALVQYYSVEDATSAIQGAHDIVVDGRRIRTEQAMARRAVVVVKIGGGSPTIEEVRDLLSKYGPIKNMHPTTHADARLLGCPEGVWVEFAFYDDYKDAVKLFNNKANNMFRLHVPSATIETRNYRPTYNSPRYMGFRSPRSSTDQKSIFVGNLPRDTSEEELTSQFSRFGTIKAVNVIHKPVQGGSGYNVFGFVEFASAFEAEQAAAQEMDLRGQRIRVEPKEYSARRFTRLQNYVPTNTFHSGGRLTYQPIFASSTMQYASPPSASHFYSAGHNYGMSLDYNRYHQGNTFNGSMYVTPPPSNRVGRRNELVFSGSPHGIPLFPQLSMHPSAYNMNMETINEMDYDSQHGLQS